MNQVSRFPHNTPPSSQAGGQAGVVFNIMRYSVADGPGLRTTVFLKGCPLHCAWCHNPESQSRSPYIFQRLDRCLGCGDCMDACGQGAITPGPNGFGTDPELCILCRQCLEACPSGARDAFGQLMSLDQVMIEVLKDLPFYEQSGGGVTFSGGEPLMQAGFLLNLLIECKRQGLHTAVDTSGCVNYDVIDEIDSYVDLFLYDLKLMDPMRHQELTGADNQVILRNLERLIKEGARVMVRIPLVPGVNDSPADLEQSADFLAQNPPSHGLELLPYHNTAGDKYRLLGREPYQPPQKNRGTEEPEALAGIFRQRGLRVRIGGISHE